MVDLVIPCTPLRIWEICLYKEFYSLFIRNIKESLRLIVSFDKDAILHTFLSNYCFYLVFDFLVFLPIQVRKSTLPLIKVVKDRRLRFFYHFRTQE